MNKEVILHAADYKLHFQLTSLVTHVHSCTHTPTNKTDHSSGWHCNQKQLALPSLPLGWHRSLQYCQTQSEKENGVQVSVRNRERDSLILSTHNVLECGYVEILAQSSIDNGQYASKIEAWASIQAKNYKSHALFPVQHC